MEFFYLGVVYYELGKYNEALSSFNDCLDIYKDFSDAKFWKGKALIYLGQDVKGQELMREGKQDFFKGYTFNEASSLYEKYPYQITWEWNYIVK